MKITSLLKNNLSIHKYAREVKSAQVCLLYDAQVKKTFESLCTSKSLFILNNILHVSASSHAEASHIKMFEFQILQELNQLLTEKEYQVKKLRFEIRSA